MTELGNSISSAIRSAPWNKSKLIGAKPPLRPKHVWSIRTKLQVDGRIRDLALFNLAIDSKLRGCDVVALRVDDISPNGYAVGVDRRHRIGCTFVRDAFDTPNKGNANLPPNW